MKNRMSMTSATGNLLDTLTRLNWHYGRGEVVSYSLDGVAAGWAIRRIPTTSSTFFKETRRFRLVGSTVHFLGHQSKVKA
jgi:hypothetical protein